MKGSGEVRTPSNIKKIAAIALVAATATIMSSVFLGLSCRSARKGPKPNVLFITVDTMRGDYLGMLKKTAVETPVMDRLATGGVLFERMVVSGPLTRVSHASMFTGLFPPQNTVRDNVLDRLPADAHTMAEYFKEDGYGTGAVVSALPVGKISGLDQGFDYFDATLLDEHLQDRGTRQVSIFKDPKAAQVNEKAFAWLRGESGKKKPWFLWVHYFDVHAPYIPPAPFDLLYRDNLYAGEVAYVDANIGILLGELRRLGMDANTLIVLTSDHGEALGEHEEVTHGWLTYNDTTQVFAVFNWAGVIDAGRRVTEPVRNVDLFATVMDMVGIRIKEKVPSRSLRPLFKSAEAGGNGAESWPAAYSEALMLNQELMWYPIYAIRDGRFHLIRAKEAELYDVDNDPKEENNLASVKPDDVKRLSAKLDALQSEFLKGTMLKAETSVLSDKDRRKLQALGYITSSTRVINEPGPTARNLSGQQMRQLMWLSNAALFLFWEGKVQESLAQYLKIIEIDPDAVEPYYNLGRLSFEAGNLDEAIKYYEKYVSIAPGIMKARGLTEQGAVWVAKGNAIRAEKFLKDAIKLDPAYPLAHLNLGMVYGRQEMFKEAEKEFNEALKLDSEFAMAHYGLGLIYAHDPRRQNAAIEEYSQALKYDPNLAVAHISMGLLLGQDTAVKNQSAAIIHLKRGLELEPNAENAEDARKLLESLDGKK